MSFEVRSVELAVPFEKAFEYLAERTKLPDWTYAFSEVAEDGKAIMRTPAGEVPVEIADSVDLNSGVVDTKIMFPDGNIAMAYSRLVALDETTCAYIFLLPPPPVALERLEGVLSEQARILDEELQTLKARLEG